MAVHVLLRGQRTLLSVATSAVGPAADLRYARRVGTTLAVELPGGARHLAAAPRLGGIEYTPVYLAVLRPV